MARLQLFCLPYSGASAMVYSRWRRQLPEWLSVQPVELPGRGMRLGEALQTDMQALARQLAGEWLPRIDGPYALFGHSLGAVLAFELAHALGEAAAPRPLALIASGSAAPSRREDYERDYAQPKTDAQLRDDLRTLQGTPQEVLDNQELMDLTLPILRADFLMCGRYRKVQRPALGCSMHVLGGARDKVSQEQLLAWELESTANFSLDMFPGGHFFIHEHEARVLRALKAHLEVGLRRHERLLQASA